MNLTQDESEKRYKNVYKAGGYKKPKKVIKTKKPKTKDIFNVGCKCTTSCKCKK